MIIKLDSYDKKILFELDKNARTSTSKIGRGIRKSKQFVDYRIKKLEQEGIIAKYTTIIDYSKLGYISIRVYFKFHNLIPEQQQKLINDLIRDKEVWWLVVSEGPWDVAYATAVKHPLDFYNYWDKIMKRYRRYISRRSVVIYTHIKQYPKSYLIEKQNTEEGTLVGASKEILVKDKFDLDLLRLISDNARASLHELSVKLKTSPQVVRNHLKKLEKSGVIQGYRAILNVSLLGYEYYKAYISLINTSKLKDLENYCKQHPNILNLNRTIGGNDFEIELQARSFKEFDKIMDDIKTTFAGMIDDFEFVISRGEKKMTYFPFE